MFFELDLITFWFIDAESLFLIVPNLEFQFPLWPKVFSIFPDVLYEKMISLEILNFQCFFLAWVSSEFRLIISSIYLSPDQFGFSMIFLFLDANTTATLNWDFGFSRIYRFWRSSRFVGFNKIKRRQTMKYPIKTNKLIFMVFQTKENTKSETYT